MRSHNCEALLSEEARNKFLLKSSQKILFNRLRDFVEHEYSYNPTDEELVDVCQAAVALFPSLKGLGQGGIVSSFWIIPHFVLFKYLF